MAKATPQVIDLVSSSPQAPIGPRSDSHFSVLSPPSRAAGRPKRPAPLAPGSICVNDSSFSVLIGVMDSDEFPDLEARGPKRRRTSASSPNQDQNPPGSASHGIRRPAAKTVEKISSARLETSESQSCGLLYACVPAAAFDSTRELPRKAKFTISREPTFFSSSPLPFRPVLPSSKEKISHAKKNDPKDLDSSPVRPNRAPKGSTSTTIQNTDLSDPFASSPDASAGSEAEGSINKTHSRDHGPECTDPRGNAGYNHWDPISSSAPDSSAHRAPSRVWQREVIELDSDSEVQNESDDELPDIANLDALKYQSRRRSPIRRSQSDVLCGTRKRSQAASYESIEQKNIEREANAAAKAGEKERKQKEKERAREAKMREKERAAALAEVNKVRTDKKVSTPEMIVMVPSGVDDGLKVQVAALLDDLGAQYSDWDCPTGNAFKWLRKVTSRLDEEMGRWEPISLQIMPENHALKILSAEGFVELVLNDGLDASIRQTKGQFPGHNLVYIIQGMIAWMRRNRNNRNRQFASVVRSGAADVSMPQARRRNRTANEEHISEDIIEAAILRLQVEHEVLIHHTETQLETAQWVVHFTQHISTIPYRKQRDEATSSAGFCMESGQIRTGADAHDTYIRMLQEIVRVTIPVAHGIAAEFETVSRLVNGLESGGPTSLEGLRKSANRDGGLSDRMIGKAMSRRIHKVFTGQDENSVDV